MATEKSGASATKLFTRAEVAARKEENGVWFIIHNSIYDVTSFLNEHPGGEEVLVEQNGKDATEAFEDVGHSSEARLLMDYYKVGELVEEERTAINDKKSKTSSGGNNGDDDSSGSWRSWLIPIALGVLATLVYRYFISAH